MLILCLSIVDHKHNKLIKVLHIYIYIRMLYIFLAFKYHFCYYSYTFYTRDTLKISIFSVKYI